MSASLPKKTTSPAFQAPSPSDLNGKLSMDRVSTIPSLSSSRPLTPFSKPLTPAPGSLTPPSFKDASFEPSSAAPAPKLPTPASIPLKTSFPSKPPLKPPFFSSAPPKASPPKEKVQVPLEKGGGKENSQKAKIVGAVFGLLLLLVTLPLAVYLVKQRQISPQADEPYPFSCAGLGSDYYCSDSGNCRGECTSAGTPTDCAGGQVCCDSLCMGEPPSGSCDAALQTEAEGRDLCDHGNEAKVYVWATRSQGDGCGDSSVNYTYKESSCCGDRYKDCDTSCSEDQQTHSGTVTIPAGETTSSRQSVSCRIPDDCGETNCASCQVDVDGGGWGQMAWGCQDTPPEMNCEDCYVFYDDGGSLVIDPQNIFLGKQLTLATRGFLDKEVTKARFRVKIDGVVDSPASWCQGAGLIVDGYWCETTNSQVDLLGKGDDIRYYYVEYTAAVLGDYTIESMVYGQDLKWH